MIQARARKVLQQYGSVEVVSGVEGSNPHRLIQMLLEGAIAKIAAANGYMNRGEIALKGESIGMAISIIEGLRNSLNPDAGGEIAENLERLYEYLSRLLLKANIDNNPALLDEARGLLNQIKEGWDAIPESEKSGVRSIG